MNQHVDCALGMLLAEASTASSELARMLGWHAGECDNIAGELAEAQGISAELSKERDELAACFANLEAEHVNLGNAHTSLKYESSLGSCSSHLGQHFPTCWRKALFPDLLAV